MNSNEELLEIAVNGLRSKLGSYEGSEAEALSSDIASLPTAPNRRLPNPNLVRELYDEAIDTFLANGHPSAALPLAQMRTQRHVQRVFDVAMQVDKMGVTSKAAYENVRKTRRNIAAMFRHQLEISHTDRWKQIANPDELELAQAHKIRFEVALEKGEFKLALASAQQSTQPVQNTKRVLDAALKKEQLEVALNGAKTLSDPESYLQAILTHPVEKTNTTTFRYKVQAALLTKDPFRNLNNLLAEARSLGGLHLIQRVIRALNSAVVTASLKNGQYQDALAAAGRSLDPQQSRAEILGFAKAELMMSNADWNTSGALESFGFAANSLLVRGSADEQYLAKSAYESLAEFAIGRDRATDALTLAEMKQKRHDKKGGPKFDPELLDDIIRLARSAGDGALHDLAQSHLADDRLRTEIFAAARLTTRDMADDRGSQNLTLWLASHLYEMSSGDVQQLDRFLKSRCPGFSAARTEGAAMVACTSFGEQGLVRMIQWASVNGRAEIKGQAAAQLLALRSKNTAPSTSPTSRHRQLS